MQIIDCIKKGDIWFDETESVNFGNNQHQISSGFDYNFEHSKSEWLNWKFNHVLNIFSEIGSGDYIFNTDYIYRKPLSFKKYEDSTILILGGGPSTSKFLKETNFYGLPDFKDIDYYWSLNKFYKNSNLPKIDLAVLGKEVDKFDSDLIDYIKHNSTDIVFEEDKDDMSGELHIQSLFPDNTSFYKTRYASKLGIGARFIVYSILLGVKKIYFVGMDGLCLDLADEHSFEKNKAFPTWGLSYEKVYHLIKRQFIVYWEYILELQKIYDFEIINLSEKYTDVSTFGKITKEWNEKY